MKDIISKLDNNQDLNKSEVNNSIEYLLDISNPEDIKVDFLSSLSKKGESYHELYYFTKKLLPMAVIPKFDKSKFNTPLIDICGTGGDKLNLFNISTTCIFILASCGVSVIKHGNRGITSKSGGADVLESLGININSSPERFEECVLNVGAGFLFAPTYHPAFKAIAPVRKKLSQLGQRSIFNFLGPLLNPIQPEFQLIGIFDNSWGEKYANVLQKLERNRAWVIHGNTSFKSQTSGMDEISTIGLTSVWETDTEKISSWNIDPSIFNFSPALIEDLKGLGPKKNAKIIINILSGDIKGPMLDIVLLNSAACLVITKKVKNIKEGINMAKESIESKKALNVLRKWQIFK